MNLIPFITPWNSLPFIITECSIENTPMSTCADPEGDRESKGPPPPLENHKLYGKSQVIWVSIGNKRLDPPPPPPGKKVGPSWKMLDPPLELWNTLENYSFLWNKPLNLCEISWRLIRLGILMQKNTISLFYIPRQLTCLFPLECQTVWIKIRSDIWSALVWVQTVCDDINTE